MYSEVGLELLSGVVFITVIWLIFLTWYELGNRKLLKQLLPRGNGDLRKKLEEVLASVESFKGDIKNLDLEIKNIKDDSLGHIQKVALVRYNPYGDTGGDISFSLAMLSKKGDGMVVTSLHSRSGTRVYAKAVAAGKSVKYEFSREEEEAIKKALD